MSAVEALDSMDARIPWHDPETGRGDLRRIVSVGDIPRGPGALEDVVRMIVDLPPGSGPGPQVSPALGDVGGKVRSGLHRHAQSGLPMVLPRRDPPSRGRSPLDTSSRTPSDTPRCPMPTW